MKRDEDAREEVLGGFGVQELQHPREAAFPLHDAVCVGVFLCVGGEGTA